MPVINWSNSLSVGVESMDNEHKKLVGMLNDLVDAVNAGKGKDAVGQILDRLIDYTKVHFAHEEDFMQKAGFADFPAHKKEHEDLARQVTDLQSKFHSGKTSLLSVEVLNFLKNWLVKHIQGSDKKYGPVLSAKGIR